MKNKLYTVLNKIYGFSMIFAFFLGFLPVIPFVIAILIGGSMGESISLFMYNKVYPIAFVMASVAVVVGLIAMYIRGEKSLSVESYEKKNNN